MERDLDTENKAEVSSDLRVDSTTATIARKQWELNNDIQEITSDAYWAPDGNHMTAARTQKPWRTDYKYFSEVKISALAAVKMFIHAKRGSPSLEGRRDWFEVMGLLLGHFRGREMYVTDSFGLPVDATEVECSMNEHSQVYMVDYLNYHRRVGKPDRGCIGWYHTHPGYTCFLSGIDVNTQQLSQQAQDPWVAVVVDPVRTISTGKLNLKAFRTFPEEHVALHQTGSVSSDVVKRYGVHAHRYYELPVIFMRNSTDAAQLDALWGQYWALTFSTNPLIANRCFHTQQINIIAGLAVSCECGRREAASATESKQKQANKADQDVTTLSPLFAETWGSYTSLLKQSKEKEMPAELIAVHQSRESQVQELSAALGAEVLLGGIQILIKQHIFGIQ